MVERHEPGWPRSVLVLTWFVSSLLYAAVTTVVFHSFVVTAFDSAIIEQVVARLAHVEAPITEVEGEGANYFGDHFSPILAVYAPFYRVVPAPETLFVVQGAVLGLSVVVVLVTATRFLGRGAGLVVTLLYTLSFGLVNGVVMSARETPFAVLFLALAGACFLQRSTRGVVLASLGLLLVKEDLGLTVAAIGFVLALEQRSRRAGVALMVVGPAVFVVVVGVVIPAFASGGASPYVTTSDAMLEAAAAGGGSKLATLVITCGVTGMLCLGNRWCLVALPTLAWRFTAPNPAYWTTLWHYSAPLMPVVFLAALPVVQRAGLVRRRLALAVAVLMTALSLSLTAAVQVTGVVAAFRSDRPDDARRALDAVPVGATVVADEYLLGHLAADRTAYYIPVFRGCPRPQFVTAHVGPQEKHIWGGRVLTPDFASLAELVTFAEETYGAPHEVVAQEGQLVVLRRSAQAPDEPCVPAEPDVPVAE